MVGVALDCASGLDGSTHHDIDLGFPFLHLWQVEDILPFVKELKISAILGISPIVAICVGFLSN